MTQQTLSHFIRRVALFFFVAASALLAASLTGKPQLTPTALAATADHGKTKDNYDLTQLETFRKVVVEIKDNYVDPKRIEPKEMFLAALEAVEKSVAEVMVEGNAKEGRVKVTCGNATKEFRFDDVESIWMIPHRIKPIFQFIQDNLVSTENKRSIEYDAINGMLSTLDPHSWLLKPDMYREMKLQTKGEFGGLGFVIQMDEDRLIVKKVLKNTPASRAGIKKGDHITRIEDESTVNMDLNDAVTKLRGKPGTGIRIFVKRDQEEERPFNLTRDLISIESVTSQLLPEGVGYVRLASFAGTTSRDLAAAIRDLKAANGGHLKGLVMDLRSNPGGLLEQAIQVADQFIDEGTIVTTAGMSDKLREPKPAHNDGNDREFPIAVLVNSESASASEIVAGAMKNLNRAVIIGRQTFGKGSVQVLYDLPEGPSGKDEAALKLTIAQYLTPGDQSIQEIGVTPDIELIQASIAKDKVDLFAPPKLLREVDLDKHFSNGFQPVESKKLVEATEKPSFSLRYLQEQKPGKKLDKDAHAGDDDDDAPAEEPDDDQIASDYQVLFARDLILRAPKTDRLGMLSAAGGFLDERRVAEEAKIEKAVTALGLNWSVDPQLANATAPAGASLDFKVSPAHPSAGEFATLTATVTNNSTVPLERLRAYTRCDADKMQYQNDRLCSRLDRKEFLFGRVDPGEKRSWSTRVKIDNYTPATHEPLTMVFQEAHNDAPPEQKVELDSVEPARPAFAFSYQVLTPDGLAQPGESVSIQVDVKNTGEGATSKNTYVGLRSTGSDKIFMKKGRVSLGRFLPGETKSATLTLEVRHGHDPSQGVPLKIEIADRDMYEFTAGQITLPSVVTAPAFVKTSGAAHVAAETAIVAAPVDDAASVAQAHPDAVLPVIAKVGDYYKVEWSKDHTGFIKSSAVSMAEDHGTTNRESKVSARMNYEPPVITVADADTTKAPITVNSDRITISGTAADPNGLQDVRIFVDGDKKVFFRTARKADGAVGAKTKEMPFTADIALKPGNNTVLILARQDDDFLNQRTLSIYRTPLPVGIAAKDGKQPQNEQ